MSARVLLNSLNEFRKSHKTSGLPKKKHTKGSYQYMSNMHVKAHGYSPGCAVLTCFNDNSDAYRFR